MDISRFSDPDLSWLKLVDDQVYDEAPLKVTQAEARYTPDGGPEFCRGCVHFTSPYACDRVLGDVTPNGWCKFYECA